MNGKDTYAPPPGGHFPVADDSLDRPVATLDENLRPAIEDARERRILVEPGDQRHRFERGDHRQTIGQRIDRPVVAFAEAPDRRVGVQGHDQRRTQRSAPRREG
jgi:hypothetical protein